MSRIENRMLVDSEWESIEDQFTDEEQEMLCECCGHKVLDFYFLINGNIFCEDCMNDEFRREVV